MSTEQDVKLAKVIISRLSKVIIILAGTALLLCSSLIPNISESAKISLSTVGTSMVTSVVGLDTVTEIKKARSKK